MARTKIIGTGSYAPSKVITNQDLEKIVETNDAWIVERTGIKERRQAAPEEATSDLATKAAVQALEMAGTRPEDLDLIIVGTVTPDMQFPSCATLVQAKLSAKKAFAFDVSAACAGSLFALSLADQYIKSGMVRRALVIGAELLTRITNWEDRNTCILFGDGAGAMVLAPSEDDAHGLLSTHLHTDGTLVDILLLPGGGSKMPLTEEGLKAKANTVSMNGREVYKFAVRALADVTREALAANGATADQVTHVIAHQANLRIIEAVLQRVEVPLEKCWVNIHKYGNTSSASLPMTLDEANRAGRLKKGDLITMMSIGAGMAWGSALMRW